MQVLSSPKMLCTNSPLSTLLKKTGSCRSLKSKPVETKKANFPKNPSKFCLPKEEKKYKEEDEDEKEKERDETCVVSDDESPRAQKLPTHSIKRIHINSNELKWIKEQKGSKDTAFFQKLHAIAVRTSSGKKLSQFRPSNQADPMPEEDQSPTIQSNSNLVYCVCGELCNGDNVQCNACLQKKKPIDYAGYLLARLEFIFRPYWFRILNKELYCISI